MGKTGSIEREELKYYLNHWGFRFNDETFNDLWKILDVDKDGHISYEDFQNSVGKEISPPEFLYFRQDNTKNLFAKCNFPLCWEQ